MNYYLRYGSGYVTISVEMDEIGRKANLPSGFDSRGFIIYAESVDNDIKNQFGNVVSESAVLSLGFFYPNLNADAGGARLPGLEREYLINFSGNKIAPAPEGDPEYVSWAAGFVSEDRVNQSISLRITFDTTHPDFFERDKTYRFHFRQLSISNRENCFRSDLIIPTGFDVVLGGGVWSARDISGIGPDIYEPAIGLDFGNNSSSVCILADKFPSPDDFSKELILQEDSLMSVCKGDLLKSSETSIPGSQEVRALFHSSFVSSHSARNALRCNIGKKRQHFVGVNPDRDLFAHRSMKRSLAHPRSHEDDKSPIPNVDLTFAQRWFEKFGSFNVDGKEKPFLVPRRAPAELYLTEILDKIASRTVHFDPNDCSRGRVGLPSNIVLTYPITYGLREIFQYKKCFARAILRHLDVMQVVPGSGIRASVQVPGPFASISDYQSIIKACFQVIENPSLSVPEFPVKAMIDEASAAAYFYVRKFLVNSNNFNLNGFRFQYPEGCRIVIIDCGAGTTDVAAFDVMPVFESESQAKRIVKVQVTLKKRTGDHHFCGDYVTKQIVQLIKAKIIYANETAANSNRRIPEAERFAGASFNQGAGRVNNPLEFTRAVYRYFDNSLKDSVTRKELAFLDTERPTQKPDPRKAFISLRALIELSENLKKEFSKEERSPQGVVAPVSKRKIYQTVLNGMKGVESLINDFYNKADSVALTNGNVKNVMARLENITVHYEELKEIIEGGSVGDHGEGRGLLSFVDMVKNSIIFPVSEDDDQNYNRNFNELFVSRVVVTGKGSLFRSIMETFSEKLGLLDPSTQLVNLASLLSDPEQLKRCVSIGASWWLADRNSPGASIVMDCEMLSKVLPYDLVIDGRDGEQCVVPVGTPYDEINQSEKIVDPFTTDNPIDQIRLKRRYPGGKADAFASFKFSSPVREYRIRWDKDNWEFVVGNATKDPSFVGDEDSYSKSPLWDGSI